MNHESEARERRGRKQGNKKSIARTVLKKFSGFDLVVIAGSLVNLLVVIFLVLYWMFDK